MSTKLFRYNYPPEHPRGLKTHELFAWSPVHTETGEVDMDIKIFDDDLRDLVTGWEWKKFRLVPADVPQVDKLTSLLKEWASAVDIPPRGYDGGGESGYLTFNDDRMRQILDRTEAFIKALQP